MTFSFQKFDALRGSPRYEAAIAHALLNEGYREYTKEEEEVLLEYTKKLFDTAKKDNIVENVFESFDNWQMAMDLTSRDKERVQQARDKIIARKQSQGELLAMEEQQRVKQAQKDASPLKPLEDLIEWIKKQWEEWIFPTLKSIKQMFDALWPLIEKTLAEMPNALDIIRKDLVEPYLAACKDWKQHAQKVSDELRTGAKASALDKPGMPALIPPNLNMQEVTALSAALSIGFVHDMVVGMIAPLLMEQYQQNTKRGFYDDLAMFNWLLGIGGAGPNIAGMAKDIVGASRRVGRAAGGLAGALADAPDMMSEIPDWFLEHTVPKVDIATGKTDYYLY